MEGTQGTGKEQRYNDRQQQQQHAKVYLNNSLCRDFFISSSCSALLPTHVMFCSLAGELLILHGRFVGLCVWKAVAEQSRGVKGSGMKA